MTRDELSVKVAAAVRRNMVSRAIRERVGQMRQTKEAELRKSALPLVGSIGSRLARMIGGAPSSLFKGLTLSNLRKSVSRAGNLAKGKYGAKGSNMYRAADKVIGKTFWKGLGQSALAYGGLAGAGYGAKKLYDAANPPPPPSLWDQIMRSFGGAIGGGQY